MKDIITLKDLLCDQLHSLHFAEQQWDKIMTDFSIQTGSRELGRLFERSAGDSRRHAEKLEAIINQLEAGAIEKKNRIVEDLHREIKELMEKAADPEVRDAGLIVIHQCMNHYFIAKYGSLSSFARLLNQDAIAAALHNILDEEKEFDEHLTRLAKEKINPKAKSPVIM